MSPALKNRLQVVQKTVQSKTAQLLTGGATLLGTGGAFAQSANFNINVEPLTEGINQVFVAVGTIGPAILLVWLAIKAYKWIRVALS